VNDTTTRAADVVVERARRTSHYDGGTQVTVDGAAVSNVAPGNVALYSIVPSRPGGEYRNWASAEAAETTPTSEPWDFIVAQAILREINLPQCNVIPAITSVIFLQEALR
jgi:hypothetical protein